MTYAVLDWEKSPVAGPDLQARFEAGKEFEKLVVRELLEMGFQFEQSQMPVQIKNRSGEIIATGKIDGFIKWEGIKIPVEIKSMHPQIFQSIKSADDFRKKPWLRRYTKQLMMYMFGNSCEWGLFIVGDLLGHWKMLPLALDYGEAESILQRLERVHESIKAKRYPDRIVYDQSICGKCPFSAICLQDVIQEEAAIVDSPELEAQLERHEELKPLAGEFKELHDNIKDSFKGKLKTIVGARWLIQSIPSKRTTYEIPPEVEAEIDELKKSHAVAVPVERLIIEKIGK
jgi:CRISPR/Cas system-associated exonuclease Cas4 (RecB family)